ncbi:Tol-Pal system protein TolB [Nymphon striatum]|nr:Tol-Pal system protein TolB [Nymphon striatum]
MAEMNVVPYIDVMLVLLVIFMVTAPMMQSGVNVNMPDADAALLESDSNQPPLYIAVRENGEISLGESDEIISTSELTEQMKGQLGETGTRPDTQANNVAKEESNKPSKEQILKEKQEAQKALEAKKALEAQKLKEEKKKAEANEREKRQAELAAAQALQLKKEAETKKRLLQQKKAKEEQERLEREAAEQEKAIAEREAKQREAEEKKLAEQKELERQKAEQERAEAKELEEKEQAEKQAKLEAERIATEKKKEEKLAKEKAKKKAEELAKKKAAEKEAKEKAAAKKEAERKARKLAEKKAKEKAIKEAKRKKEKERIAKEKAAKKAAEKAAKLKKEKEAKEAEKRKLAEKKKAEEAAKAKAAKEKAERERIAAAKAAKEKAEREKAEALAAKKAEYHRKWQEAQAKKKAEAAAAEAKRKSDAEAAAKRKSLEKAKHGALVSWGGRITQHVRRRWHPPPGSKGDLAVVRITISNSGFISSGIQMSSCSGTPEFCASVKEAFERSEPLPRPPSKFNLTLFILTVSSLPALAELELSISKTTDEGIPIYLDNIPGGATGVIEGDLKRSGRFTIIDRSKITNLTPFGGQLNGGQYKNITDYIVRGKPHNGGLQVELISTSDNAKTTYTISSNSNPRRVYHKAADKIYEKITREKGAFDTRLAYVTVTNKASSNRVFRLYVSDSDGHGSKVILTSRQPIMSPAWSPDEKYMLSSREGINSAPAWSPDGTKVAMSLSFNGSPDIYTVDANTGDFSRVTTSSAIDTEPSWSGTNSLVFTSNRGGSPQLYRIAATGGKAQRLTFDGKYNSAADIANKKLAFITGKRGAYNVAIKSITGQGKDFLSNGTLDESPTLSPNGAMVAYTTLKNGENTLAVVSDNAKARQFLTSPIGDIREPAWSPYLNH